MMLDPNDPRLQMLETEFEYRKSAAISKITREHARGKKARDFAKQLRAAVVEKPWATTLAEIADFLDGEFGLGAGEGPRKNTPGELPPVDQKLEETHSPALLAEQVKRPWVSALRDPDGDWSSSDAEWLRAQVPDLAEDHVAARFRLIASKIDHLEAIAKIVTGDQR